MAPLAEPSVLFAAAELAPLARVGGLAEAASGLARQLRADGVELDVVVPDYSDLPLADETVEEIPVPEWAGGVARVRRGVHDAVGPIALVATAGTAKPHPYVDTNGVGWPDNDVRFFGFSAAVAEIAARTSPGVVHLNDWHTAATLGFIGDRRPSVLTIHTLGHQGWASPQWLDRLPHHSHAYAWYDSCNPLAGAIRLADRIIAVSPNYAREIVTQEFGSGLHDELAARGDALVGIRNGIDVTQWSPATDPHLAKRYTAATVARNKPANRRALLDRVGLADEHGPVFGAVTRLVDQKGIDLLLETVWFLERLGAKLVVLGSGDAGLVDGMRWAATTFPDRVAFVDGYDAELAHQIFGGADLFVMPSRFEPCGLAQMQAMAYGTVPVVTDLGGLHDTVVDADADPDAGTGILAPWPTGAALTDALHRGAALWRDRTRRARARDNGMAIDWSWAGPAAQHRELYRTLVTD